MTARVSSVLAERYKGAGKLQWGWAFQGKVAESHVSYDAIKCQHDRVMKKLTGFKTWRLYDTRHTYLTRLGESGVDGFTIQTLEGHSSIVTSQRYVHPTPECVEDAITRLETYNARKTELAKETA
jgi:integrase